MIVHLSKIKFTSKLHVLFNIPKSFDNVYEISNDLGIKKKKKEKEKSKNCLSYQTNILPKKKKN